MKKLWLNELNRGSQVARGLSSHCLWAHGAIGTFQAKQLRRFMSLVWCLKCHIGWVELRPFVSQDFVQLLPHVFQFMMLCKLRATIAWSRRFHSVTTGTPIHPARWIARCPCDCFRPHLVCPVSTDGTAWWSSRAVSWLVISRSPVVQAASYSSFFFFFFKSLWPYCLFVEDIENFFKHDTCGIVNNVWLLTTPPKAFFSWSRSRGWRVTHKHP